MNKQFFINNEMTEKLTGDENPDFSTLSGIMDYFKKVPFKTFNQKLNDWFLSEIPVKRPDLLKPDGEIDLPPGFFDLLNKIVAVAEEKDQANLN